MTSKLIMVSRRRMLASTASILAAPPRVALAQWRSAYTPEDFGHRSGRDATRSLQQALDQLAAEGGGTLRLIGRYRAGSVHVRGRSITIAADGAVLVDARLVIAREASNIEVRGLTIIETRGRADSYLLDVSGQDCRFDRLSLIKRPAAGGYQAYVRATSAGCLFDGLTLQGSNGLFIAGRNHRFERFDLTSTLRRDIGGDDAFAIKAPGTVTENIQIRNGTVRGFAAAVSIGSEVGSSPEHPRTGIVRRVFVENVRADRCQMVCFIKPGALIYDWRTGVVEDVTLTNISLDDPAGVQFTRGVAITVGRGATVRRVIARNIAIRARAASVGVMQTSAIELDIRPFQPGGRIEDVDLQVRFDGSGAEGHPVDHIVRIEKANPRVGTMRSIRLDVDGTVSRVSGIHVGLGLDDAITIRKARLRQVAAAPPSSLGAAGIWIDSRVRLGDIEVDALKGPRLGGRARDD